MKEHPIIFKLDLVEAILSGKKTETRRIIKPQPSEMEGVPPDPKEMNYYCTDYPPGGWAYYWGEAPWNSSKAIRCPYGLVGDKLWVRETTYVDGTGYLRYKADESTVFQTHPKGWDKPIGRTIPSIHMPRWVCRLILEVIDIKVEILQDITLEGVIAEGFDLDLSLCDTLELKRDAARGYFKIKWNEINAKRGYSWESNPWVWVVKFKKVGGE